MSGKSYRLISAFLMFAKYIFLEMANLPRQYTALVKHTETAWPPAKLVTGLATEKLRPRFASAVPFNSLWNRRNLCFARLLLSCHNVLEPVNPFLR